MKKIHFTTLRLVRIAVISAVYATLTLALAPISYGAVQFRIAEALTVLPIFFPEAIFGLAIGCLLANIPVGIIDMVVGSLATLIAGFLTYKLKKIYLAVLPPIIINAFAVPIILLTIPEVLEPYWLNVITVGAGQAVVILSLGLLLYFAVKKSIAKGVIRLLPLDNSRSKTKDNTCDKKESSDKKKENSDDK